LFAFPWGFSMRRNLRALFYTVLFVACAHGCRPLTETAPSAKDLLKLQQGMESEDVEILLGKPVMVRQALTYEWWDYNLGGEKWTISLNEGRMIGKARGDGTWGMTQEQYRGGAAK
jgi:hypothetical protein